MRILIASEDAETRQAVQRAAETTGHVCVTAADGHAAWLCLKAEPFDVVISELSLAGLDGLALCRQLRGDPGTEACGFILLTADSAHRGLLAGLEAGVDDCLALPLHPDALQARLLAAEHLRGQRGQLAEQAALLRLNDRLLEQARRDPLTQLLNRPCLREDLTQIEASFEAEGRCYSAVLGDLDYFDDYNQRHGFTAGDDALKLAATALDAQCRASDRLYRYGGEEFLLILADLQAGLARAVAERLRLAVRGLPLPTALTMSVGVAELQPRTHMTVADWLRAAEAALAAAKTQGRDRVIAADPPDDPSPLEHLN